MKEYKKINGQLIYLMGNSPASLYIYKDKLVIKEALFRFLLRLINKKDFTVFKNKIKEIKYIDKWPYRGINIISDEYVAEELVFRTGMSKEEWQDMLSKHGYKVE